MLSKQKNGGMVVAVDGRKDNLAYLRASLQINSIPLDNVALLHHTISNITEPLYPVSFKSENLVRINGIDDNPETNPGSISFVRKEDVGKRKVLGPPTISTTISTILDSLPTTAKSVIIKMDIQGHECRVLDTPNFFDSIPYVPYIFMEWAEMPSTCSSIKTTVLKLKKAGYSPR